MGVLVAHVVGRGGAQPPGGGRGGVVSVVGAQGRRGALRIASLSYHIHIKTFGIRFLKALKLNLTPLSLNFDFLGGQT